MTLWCDCPNCGGTDEGTICENALMEAQFCVAKSERRLAYAWAVTIALVVIAVGIAFVA